MQSSLAPTASSSYARHQHRLGSSLAHQNVWRKAGDSVQRKYVPPAQAESTEYSGTALKDPEWSEEGIVSWARPKIAKRVLAPANSPPIVILPGFGNCTADYVAPFGNEEASIASNLKARGFSVYVVQLERKDWFKVARALLTLRFWSASLTTDPGYTWYLERVDQAVKTALAETGAKQVDLVGHSAGGWLGRAYLGDPKYFPVPAAAVSDSEDDSAPSASKPTWAPISSTASGGEEDLDMDGEDAKAPALKPNSLVRSLVTLGTPQRPPPATLKRDMTGGALTWVHRTFPGAFFAKQGVRYVTVAGRTVRGYREPGVKSKGPRTPPMYAYDSYGEVCGEGQGVEGDCVVPLRSAFLAGAKHVMLDGVFHSMSRIGTFEEEAEVVWYGSDDVIDAWLGELVGQAPKEGKVQEEEGSNGNGGGLGRIFASFQGLFGKAAAKA